jgi:uncharacterized protein (TIGR03435 family)
LAELAKKFDGKPLRIISVTDESRDKIARFLKAQPMPGWVAYDGGAAFTAFGVRARPVTVLIDAKGKIAAKTYPSAVDEQILNNLLAGKPLAAPAIAMEDSTEAADAKELLSLRIAVSSEPANMGRMSFGDNFFEARALSLPDILTRVYDVSNERLILSKPGSERYNLKASVPRSAAGRLPELMRLGVEAALGLRSHREKRAMAVLVMRRAKHAAPGLKPSQLDNEAVSSFGASGLKVRGATISGLTEYLEFGLHKPVIDETGLAGRFDVELEWVAGKGESARREILDKLGLKLEPGRRQMPVVVVEGEAQEKSAKILPESLRKEHP